MAGLAGRAPAEVRTLSPRRLFNNNYDSVEQKKRAADLRDGFARFRQVNRKAHLPAFDDVLYTEILGRARMDLILSGSIILTDAQLLDGAIFTRLDPDSFVRDLAIPGLTGAPIEVMTRGETLEESLVAMLNRDGRAKPFEFSCLSTSAASRVTTELHRLKSDGQPGPTDLDGIFALFARCHVPTAEQDRIRLSWEGWQTLVQSGRVPVRRWFGRYDIEQAIEDANRTADEDISLASGRSPDRSLGLETESQAAWREAESSLKANVDRTIIIDNIRSKRLPRYDEFALLMWLNMVYGFALRNQHDCMDAEFLDASQLYLRRVAQPDHAARSTQTEVISRLEALGVTSVALPSDYLMRLGTLPTMDIGSCVSSRWKELEAWRREEPDGPRGLRDAMKAIEERMARPDSGVEWWDRLMPDVAPPGSLGNRSWISRMIHRHRDQTADVAVTASVMIVKEALPAVAGNVLDFAIPAGRKIREHLTSNPSIVTDIGVRRQHVAPHQRRES